MVKDIQIKKLARHVDDRGFFMEVLRDDDQLLKKFGQFSMSQTFPGVIKAFHYHKIQDDLWFFPVGNAQVVLYDIREDSPTKGETNVFYMGEYNPMLLYIPAGVAHGYRVLGNTPAIITYVTTESYQSDQPDEYRIAWNSPEIGFNWETQNR
jgi:dTDP-4-dehydrorhamnose 3,5-epimerase